MRIDTPINGALCRRCAHLREHGVAFVKEVIGERSARMLIIRIGLERHTSNG